MKKNLILALAMAAMVVLAACGNKTTTTPTNTPATPTNTPSPTEAQSTPTDVPATPTPTEAPFDPAAKSEGVMTFAQYSAAEMESQVVIECYVQDHQSWYKDKITVYAADPDGAYFIYNMACSEDDAKKLVKGTKIKVTGFKGEFSGEVEVKEATFEFGEGTYVVEKATDVTALLGTADLEKHMNEFAAFNNLTIEPSTDADGNPVAFLYKHNGSGQDGDDLYFKVNSNGEVYTFTVESYLCGKGTDVYEAVKNFKIGDVVDLEGYVYWYNGINPHITSAKVKGNAAAKSDGVMTYAQYAAAKVDDAVVIECYVQDHQSWYQDKLTVYAADPDGAYFIYNMTCTEADSKKLVPGTKIKVTGFKAEWSGEVELAAGATFEIIDAPAYIAPAVDITAVFESGEDISKYMNRKFRITGANLSFSMNPDGIKVPFLYKDHGQGEDGDDLYFEIYVGDKEMTCTVESYLRGKGTDVYEGVKQLKLYSTINIEGYLYYYIVPNPHITKVEVTQTVE
jgi:hypothetical protein